MRHVHPPRAPHYAQDGQALWSTSADSYGMWRLEETLDSLYARGAISEFIVIAIDMAERRVECLIPVPDSEQAGGHAEAHLRALVEGVRREVNERYRTRAGRTDTALLGSSLGGLFSFYDAWLRPDVFVKAACLSSNFGCAER